ncbi:MAG: hypothetical protein ACYTDE_09615 [Planctomycetota bacterium]|jgi:hypothetical protein
MPTPSGPTLADTAPSVDRARTRDLDRVRKSVTFDGVPRTAAAAGEDSEILGGLGVEGTGADHLQITTTTHRVDQGEPLAIRLDGHDHLPRSELLLQRRVDAREKLLHVRHRLGLDFTVVVEDLAERDVDLRSIGGDDREVGLAGRLVDSNAFAVVQIREQRLSVDPSVLPTEIDRMDDAAFATDPDPEVDHVVADQHPVVVVERGEKSEFIESVDHVPGNDVGRHVRDDAEIGRGRGPTRVLDGEIAGAARTILDHDAISGQRCRHGDAGLVVDRVDDFGDRRRERKIHDRRVSRTVLDTNRTALDAGAAVEILEENFATESAVPPFEGHRVEPERLERAAGESA